MMQSRSFLILLLVYIGLLDKRVASFIPIITFGGQQHVQQRGGSGIHDSYCCRRIGIVRSDESSPLCMATIEETDSNSGGGGGGDTESINQPPVTSNPMFDGKRVLPIKIVQAGLKAGGGDSTSKVAAVYAVLNSKYVKGSTESTMWTSFCEHIGTTVDLQQTLQDHVTEYGGSGSGSSESGVDRVSYVRAISFSVPNNGAMESIASDWRRDVFQRQKEDGSGKTNFDPVLAAMDADSEEDDDDDDFDDDNDDDYFEMMAGAMAASRSGLADARGIDLTEERDNNNNNKSNEEVVSPFQQYSSTAAPGSIPFSKENVDKVLEEIRPYLISDGGNVSVERVEVETQDVYLKLQGACGSCPSSTITMQMGIERVLKENFPNLGQVLQVDDDDDGTGGNKESEFDIVQREVDRIKPAIIAMGGKVEILNVDVETGTVQLNFEGASRVRQGLELALLDIDFVQKVDF
jgi:Fe-S cluster biogenesis protein NfuA